MVKPNPEERRKDHRRGPQDRSRAITLAGRNSDLDPAPRTTRERRRAPTTADSRQRSPPTPTRSERQAKRRSSPCPRPYARIATRASVESTEEIAEKPVGSDGSRLVDERIGSLEPVRRDHDPGS